MPLIDRDEEHLKILSICYVAWAAWSAIMMLFALPLLAFGIALSSNPSFFTTRNGQPPPPLWLGTVFISMAIGIFVIVVAITVLSYFCSRFLKQRRHRNFCMVVAVLTCLSVPIGTLLGVLTIVVLEREEVRLLFAQRFPTPPPTPG